MLTKADICRKYVLPKLYAAGWNNDQINEQKTFTDGRIVETAETARLFLQLIMRTLRRPEAIYEDPAHAI
jgi:hypothetical protein